MKKTFYSALMLASFALCGALQLGASEASLLDENFAAITRSAGPGGPGGGGDYPDGPGGGPDNPGDGDNPLVKGFSPGYLEIKNPNGEGNITIQCCMPSNPESICDYGSISCIHSKGDAS